MYMLNPLSQTMKPYVTIFVRKRWSNTSSFKEFNVTESITSNEVKGKRNLKSLMEYRRGKLKKVMKRKVNEKHRAQQ